MSGAIVRKRERKGEKIILPVSPETKEKWEAVVKDLADRGYEIDTDQAVRRIIRSLEAVVNSGRPKRNAVDAETGK
ncbi:hypothetical protein ACSYAY_07385 [Leptospirillum ferriphilum]|uniref:hypothetical protein n=1 Tax=Leptospirillum ferriphilum TaxID=178606 RepID=UPI000985EE58|nr:hypothetical protein [Leptospirillum ferriphilum]OOH82463.1 hypothetical protein BOX30_03145 [Leptospirillum ferriphilum]